MRDRLPTDPREPRVKVPLTKKEMEERRRNAATTAGIVAGSVGGGLTLGGGAYLLAKALSGKAPQRPPRRRVKKKPEVVEAKPAPAPAPAPSPKPEPKPATPHTPSRASAPDPDDFTNPVAEAVKKPEPKPIHRPAPDPVEVADDLIDPEDWVNPIAGQAEAAKKLGIKSQRDIADEYRVNPRKNLGARIPVTEFAAKPVGVGLGGIRSKPKPPSETKEKFKDMWESLTGAKLARAKKRFEEIEKENVGSLGVTNRQAPEGGWSTPEYTHSEKKRLEKFKDERVKKWQEDINKNPGEYKHLVEETEFKPEYPKAQFVPHHYNTQEMRKARRDYLRAKKETGEVRKKAAIIGGVGIAGGTFATAAAAKQKYDEKSPEQREEEKYARRQKREAKRAARRERYQDVRRIGNGGELAAQMERLNELEARLDNYLFFSGDDDEWTTPEERAAKNKRNLLIAGGLGAGALGLYLYTRGKKKPPTEAVAEKAVEVARPTNKRTRRRRIREYDTIENKHIFPGHKDVEVGTKSIINPSSAGYLMDAKIRTTDFLGLPARKMRKGRRFIERTRGKRLEGTYVGSRNTFGPLKHEYIVTYPKGMKDIPANIKPHIKRIGPNREKGIVISANSEHGEAGKAAAWGYDRMRGRINDPGDVKAAGKRNGKKKVQTGVDEPEFVTRAHNAAASFGDREYPGKTVRDNLENAVGKRRNSNTFVRTVLRLTGSTEPPITWRTPGAKHSFRSLTPKHKRHDMIRRRNPRSMEIQRIKQI